jgi:hypothetical protein
MTKGEAELQSEWWKGWWEQDFSWAGLAAKPVGQNGEAIHGGTHGERDLQAWWRRDPETGETRCDDALRAVGELVTGPDGRHWHIAHVPLHWPDGAPAKAGWDTAAYDRLAAVIVRRVAAASETVTDPECDALAPDGRAQFSGAVLLRAPTHPNGPGYVVCALCDWGLLPPGWRDGQVLSSGFRFANANFSEGAGFEGADFSGKANFVNTTFSGDASFVSATFAGEASFVDATFSGAAYFDRATFSVIANFDSAAFSGEASFASVKFYEGASFESAKFFGNTNFESATFSGDVNFNRAIFNGNAKFVFTIFSGYAGLNSATFSGDVGFGSATFSGDIGFGSATFSGDASFVSATFSGDARFDSATFGGETYFNGTSFSSDASFDRATFSRDARFEKSKFSGDTRFSLVIFAGETGFERAIFSGYLNFYSAAFAGDTSFFEATFSGHARFYGGEFKSLASFREALFLASDPPGTSQPIRFRGWRFGGVAEFDGARFERRVEFTAAVFARLASFQRITWPADAADAQGIFSQAVFKDLASFQGAGLRRFAAFDGAVLQGGLQLDDADEPSANDTFRRERWQAEALPDREGALRQLEGGCRVLKQAMEKSANKAREQMFYAFELMARRHQRATPWWERQLSRLYGWTADCGRSIGRPLFWLLASIPLFALAYWVMLEPQPTYAASLSFALERLFPISLAAPDPESMRARLFGDGSTWGQFGARLLAAFQLLFSLAMAFLSGLAIRRRFQIN